MTTSTSRKRRVETTPPEVPPPFERPQGRYEKLAYVRSAKMHALASLPGGHPKGYWFDETAANRSHIFIERFCKHHKGEWAGRPLLLEGWQKFVLREVFGWRRRDGTRLYRTMYEEVARKNGKSEKTAGIGAYLLVADGEPGAEVYATATKEEQAKIVWDAAKQMVKQSPSLKKYITIRQKSLICDRTVSFFRPLGADSDTLDGLNPHAHLCDEMHAHKKRGLFDVMDTAMGARRQPLTCIITTAGVYDPESIGWEKHQYAQQVLDGIIEDDTFFAIIFAADEGDDWKNPSTWYKANPNLGISVKYDYISEQCDKAQKTPSFENTFLRLHLNVWTQQVTRWISVDKWNECGAPVPSLEQLRGRLAYGALDLSTKLDISAAAFALPDGEMYDFFWRFYVPEELVRERAKKGAKPDYEKWVKDGWLTTTPGSVIDYDFILQDLLTIRKVLKIRQIGYDPWNASQLAHNLITNGFSDDPKAEQEQLVEMRQGMKTLSEPSKEFEKLIVSNHLRHGNNPVMTWMVDNAAIRRDANDNIAPDKRGAAGKIDGLVAAIMSLGRAILTPPEDMSAYNDNDLFVL